MEIEKGNDQISILGVDLLDAISCERLERQSIHTGVTSLGLKSVYSASEGWRIRKSTPFRVRTTLRTVFPMMSSV